MSQTFRREKRLLTAAQYRRVFSEPVKSADTWFTVLAVPRTDDTTLSRLGLAIAKKQLRRAVDRNRIKRLAREIFRQHPASLAGIDFVVLTRTAVRDQSNQRLRTSLQRHFQQLLDRCRRPQA